MKKSVKSSFPIVFLLLLAAFTLLASGCRRKSSPYQPSSGPTPTPYPTGEIEAIDSADISEGYIGTMEIEGTDYPLYLHDSLSYCLTNDSAIVVYTLFTDDTLEEYTIAESIEYESRKYPVTKIDEDAFYCFANAVSITVPSSVKVIGEYAFDGCDALKEVILSEGLEEIKDSAFNDCIALESITIPSTVKTMGTGIFFGCTGLESVVLSEGVTSIPADTFTNCEALTNVELPSTLKTIGSEAFWSCLSLATLTIPEGLTAIDDRCFYDCESLAVVVLPGSLTLIGEGIFDDCDSLATVMVPTAYKDKYTEQFEEYEFKIATY